MSKTPALRLVLLTGPFLLGLFLSGASLAPREAGAAEPSGHTVVFCRPEGSAAVVKTLASDCRGTIVSEEEAAAARDRRRDYIRGVLEQPAGSPLEGRSLATLGSGFFVSEDGTVLTNEHVVAGCAAVSVTPTFGEMIFATEIEPAQGADLAILRTDATPPAVASFVGGSGPMTIASAYMIGYPEYGMSTIEPVLTTVEVLHRESNTSRGPALIVRGDVRRGNSGGPLLDTSGNVIGVVTGKLDSVSIYEATGAVVRQIGLVLPNDRIEAFLQGSGVDYRQNQRRPILATERLLLEARPFMVQIGCWK